MVSSRGVLRISGREKRKDIKKLVLDMNGGSLHSPVAKLNCELDQDDGIEALKSIVQTCQKDAKMTP